MIFDLDVKGLNRIGFFESCLVRVFQEQVKPAFIRLGRLEPFFSIGTIEILYLRIPESNPMRQGQGVE